MVVILTSIVLMVVGIPGSIYIIYIYLYPTKREKENHEFKSAFSEGMAVSSQEGIYVFPHVEDMFNGKTR